MNGYRFVSAKGKMIAAIIAILLAAVGFCTLGLSAYADAGQVPAHSKTIEENGDGTYKLELSVTGDADNETQESGGANVVVVYDVSQSMTSRAGSSRYTRADQAEDVVHDFLANLATKQNSAGDNIRVSLVNFAVTGSQVQGWTTDVNGLANRFDDGGTDGRTSFTYNGYGTNWESALQRAQTLVNGVTNNDPVFVIMITDGAPTASGNGSNAVAPTNAPISTLRDRYNAATNEAYSIASDCEETGGAFYGIYAYGTEADLLDDLMYFSENNQHRGGSINNVVAATQDAPNYFNAGETAELNAAISEIFNKIVQAMGISSASISDGTTNQVKASSGEVTELLEVDESSYEYWMAIPLVNNTFTRVNTDGSTTDYRIADNGDGTCTITWGSNSLTVKGNVTSGTFNYKWEESNAFYSYAPNAAKLKDGAVDWDLSNVGTLLDGVTYSVKFDVYPSQTALDYKARLDNGEAYDDVVPAAARDYYGADGSLKTNTEATLTYSDTRLDNPGPKEAGYVNPGPVSTESSLMDVKKIWEGDDAPELSEGLNVEILADDAEFCTANLKAPSWEKEIHISYGIIKDGEVLKGAEGHDFSFAELGSEQYRWELDAPVVHPMIIDGVKTMLVKVDDDHQPGSHTTYEIDGATYYADDSVANLQATNHRRSNLNLTKVVEGNAPADATFPFTLVVDNAKVNSSSAHANDTASDYYVWFSIQDKDGATVTDASVTGATGPNSDGYYYAPSGGTITVDMKADWNLRFINLPTGSTYTFTEGALEDEYELINVERTGADDSSFKVEGQAASGTIQVYDAKSYGAKFTNKYTPSTIDVTVEKIWKGDDENVRPTTLDVQLYADDEASGDPVTLTADKDWTYTWTGLAKNNEKGEPIEYTAKEPTVPGGYSVAYGGDAESGLKITNEYAANGSIELTATKKLEGATLKDKQFTFELVDEGGEVVQTAYNDANGDIKFDALKFDTSIFDNGDGGKAAPDAAPLVRPAVADEADAAATSDTAVTDLDAPASEGGDEAVTDEAAIDAAADEPAAEEGVAAEATDEAATGESATDEAGENAADEAASDLTTFEDSEVLLFADGGRSKTFTYTIREVNDNQGGITYDTHEITVTVTVTDLGNGKLDVTASYAGNQQFVNTYSVKPVTAKIPAKKILEVPEGLKAPDITGKFTFTLAGVDGAPEPQTTSLTNPDADGGTVEFGDIEFTAPGTYQYKVTESGFAPGVTNDTTASKTVTVTVNDKGDGTMSVDVNGGETVQFTNTYGVEPTTAKIPANKILSVPEGLTAGDITGKFTFTLAGSNGAPMPEKTSYTNPDADGGSVSFGDITYDKPGTFTYTVTESGSAPGVTNDTTASKTVTVTVNDKGDGTLEASVSPEEGVSFTNTYSVEPITAKIPVEKVLEVPTGLKAPDITGKFTFELAAVGNAPMPQTTSLTNPDADGGTVEFGDITYDKPGTFEYKVTESGSVPGVTNDTTATKTVTVVVSDKGDGTLSVEVNGGKTVQFTNSYSVEPTTAKIPVEKVLSVPAGLTPGDITGKFTFELAAVDGAPMPQTTSLTNPDADGGTVEFGDITYDKPGTFKYKVTESGSAPGVTNDSVATKTVTVTVNDKGDGTLSASVNGGQPIKFTNSYSVGETTATIPVVKVLECEDGLTPGDITGKFTFELAAVGNAPMPEKTSYTNPAADGGSIEFGPITYDKPGTYEYTVTESGSAPGVTNDQAASKNVTVVVDDKGDGTLSASVNGGKELVFTNTYSVEPVIVDPPVQKVIEGNDELYNGGDFTFTISNTKAPEGVTAPMPENTSVTNSVEYELDDKEGFYEFGEIEFTAPGTYVYKVTESGSVPGVTNDSEAESGKTIKFTVTDNGEGALEVTPTTDEAVFTFTNTYKTTPVEISLTATKVLTGKTLEDDEFTFQLKDADGNVVAEVKNAADGTIDLGTLSFDEEGTFTYTLSEVAGSDANMTYDDTVYTCEVTVTANDKAGFDAEWNWNAEPVFNNTYTEPESDTDTETETPGVPKTGDNGMLLFGFAGALALFAAGGIRLASRRMH